LRESVGAQAIAAAVVVVFLGFLGLLASGPQGNSLGLRTNGVPEFNAYAARPLEYVIPDTQSPLFGSDTAHYLSEHLHGSNFAEATLYVGITVILLALVALAAFLRRRLTANLGVAVLLLSLIALAALITSAPPQVSVLGILVPFPSHFIAKVTTTWRVYSHFVIVVMLALSALAAVGLCALTQGRRWWTQAFILALASVAVPTDLWGRLAGRTNTVAVPPVYRVLARQPSGLVAQYPLTPVGENLYDELFFQNTHGKPIINGYLEGSMEERRALSLSNLAAPNTASRLSALGVRYVVVETTPPGYGLPLPGTPGPGFRLLFKDPYANLYLVTGKPPGKALATVASGFSYDEATPEGTLDWLERPRGAIVLTGTCSPCRGLLSITASSFARPRLVTVTTSAGRVLARRTVSTQVKLSMPLEFSRQTTLYLSTTPGPQSISKTTGSPDPRSVSVQLGGLQFTESTVAPRPKRA
jgi:hypothetical protein